MAKKSAKNPTADSTAITVLPNQIPTRFIAPVDKDSWVHIGENFWEIPVEQFTEHPENSLLFNSSWKDDTILENSIKINGILVPIIANLHSDGELRVVSGHRRLLCANNLEIKTVVTEIRELSEEQELMYLFASNVARDMKDAAKIRFFKLMNQLLCQKEGYIDFSTAYENENIDDELKRTLAPFVPFEVLEGFTSRYEIMGAVTGFNERLQKTLVRVCDDKYRKRTIDNVRKIKGFAKKADELQDIWENLEKSVLNGEISLLEVDKEVVNLNKQIESLLRGKAPKEKAEKTPKQPKQKAEKITLQNDEQDTFSIKDFNQFVSEYVDANFDEIASGLALETAGEETREHLISEMKKHFRNFIHALGERL